jgi:uncharacterized membrane protein
VRAFLNENRNGNIQKSHTFFHLKTLAWKGLNVIILVIGLKGAVGSVE